MTEILVAPADSEPSGNFDLLIACLGYEARAIHVAERYYLNSKSRLALAFKRRSVANFERNLEFYEKHNFVILPFDADEFRDDLQRFVVDCLSVLTTRARLLVDISSMSRPMIATLVVVISRVALDLGIEVLFTYCPALFTKPPDVRQPVAVSQPVVPELAGWSIRPDRAVAAIVGLGFEFDQALGAVEYLEPAVAWTFIPFGEDKRFDKAVSEANRDLLSSLHQEHIVYFDVADPYKCFVELEALTYGLMDNMRPIIVPFGPKLFALLAFLIGVIHSPNVSVWRVSGDQIVPPEDRVASGRIITLNTVFLGGGEGSI